MDRRTNFIHWYFNEFHYDALFAKMQNTVEGSPHHREPNVGVHTDMVVAQYLSRIVSWDHCATLGALAAAFHDVGKPDAEERRWKDERGWYNKYAGHELKSARLWEDWAVRNWDRLVELFQLEVRDLYSIGWMIEHHLPYGIEHQEKFDGLIRTTMTMSAQPNRGANVFTTLLLSDVWGRISDDMYTPDGKVNQVDQWVDAFLMRRNAVLPAEVRFRTDRPTVTVLIGPSGSGKSTAANQMAKAATQYYSLDALRHEWYSDDYSEAFQLSCDDKSFNNNAQNRYRELLRTGQDVVVDNTNGSRKRRRFYVQEARQRGYNVRMVVMPVQIEQIVQRQKTRSDKSVPEQAVIEQFMKMNYPSYDEADDVVILGHNMES